MRRGVFSLVIFWAVSLFCFIGLARAEDDSISSLLSVLQALYEDDPSQIPDDPNEIIALETSPEARDQLAWAVFTMLRSEIDPNFVADKYPVVIEHISQSSEPNEPKDPNKSENWVAASPAFLSDEPDGYLSNPLGSCIIPAGTYLIQTLPLEIEGHVVLAAGVKLIAPYDPNHAVIEVMPGGLLDVGRASFYSDQDYPAVLPPVEIGSQDPNIPFCHNFAGIYVHRGAHPATRIQNVTILGCKIGIVLDESLTYPLHNVVAHGCYDGCHVYAPNTIINSEFWYNGAMSEGLFGYVGTGIYVYMDGVQYPYPKAVISQTVTYNGDVGIYIDGMSADPNLPDPGQVYPAVEIVNSCMAANIYCGIYQWGEGEVTAAYCGFGDNYYNSNLELPYTGCVQLPLYDIPFYLLGQDCRLYIKPNSYLIDMGYGMAEEGLGTNPDRPDTGIMDIGCHFPVAISGNFGIASSPADFNSDGIVDEADLAFLNACMGATNDPNLLRLDFNYDSRINLPDFAILSYDFGYNNDPNLPGGHDPNSERSDLNGDHWVDLDDIAMMAELWLVPVFDEYRICSLCNIGQNIDPNEPDSSGVIDVKDYEALMADWGKEVELGFSASFYDKANQPVEPNLLSGVITVQVDEYPVSSWVFAQVDGISAGVAYPYNTIPPAFEIPTYEFSNGNHTVTIGGYTYEGGCWIREIPVQFNNPLYLASIPERYEPNEVYEIRGYFDGGTMQISTDPNTVTISDSGYICHSTMTNSDTAEASLYHENGELSESQYIVFTKAVDLSREDPNSWRAVIIAPCKDANRAVEDSVLENNRLITAIEETLMNANIPYKKLIGKDAYWDNIKRALTGPKLNYVYWIGHMSSHVGQEIDEKTGKVIKPGVQRTSFECWDNKGRETSVFSWLKSDSASVPVPDLPSDWDTKGYSMTSLGLWKTKTIKEFWAIGCKSAKFNDMAMAVGTYAYKDTAGHHTHVYIGNTIEIMPGGARNLLQGYPSAISKIIRRHWTKNLNDALVTSNLTTPELMVIWGEDANRDGKTDNVLQWWPEDAALSFITFQ